MSELIFKNYGGSHQLRIQDARDLEKIRVLDDAHWAATSVPISSLNCDSVFLSYVDTDQNGRIRTDELKAAQAWLFQFLAGRSRLSEDTDILNLSDIDISHPEGQKLQAAAKLILTNLNSPDAQEISLAQVRDVQSIMASSANNGDGIIPPQATTEPDLAQFIVSIIETVGPALDASGKPGVNEEQLKIFFQEAKNFLAWKAKGEIPKGDNTTEVMPWGAETAQAYELVVSLEEKIEEYFTQCAMVRFDERSATQMQLRQKELEEIDFTNKSMMEERLKDAPLTLPNPKGILDLEGMLNPLYIDRLSELKEKVLKRALGGSVKKLLMGSAKQLTEKQWDKVKAIFAPYRAWLESRQGAKVEKLGQDLLHTYLNGTYRQRTSELIAKDLAVADDLNQLHNLEKLVLYQRWLLELANNFVSFANLYSPQRRSLLEMGRLVIDGREMTFTMKVQDRPAHKKIAEDSCMYLLYLEVTGRQDKDIKFEIVAAVTSGSAGRLRIGKRGIFFAIDGREWDAQVVDIVENPISIWESVKAPFKQFTGFIKKQIDKFSKSRQAKLETTIATPNASGITRDLLLGGGIAIAALGSAFAYITKALSQVKAVHVLGMFVGLAAFILLPGIIMGFAKIRKRNMSVLLEASAWAVNVQMRLNATLGRLFTHIPRLPEGARRERRDVLVQFVREFGYSSLRSRKPVIVALITILIVLGLIWVLITYPGWKSLF
ncbi:MAG: hypothetical protein KKH11_02760 [Candidatus Omnitrophica bacterium]|nr:hypothetical protein [Candidatus Omnitrophota bacterium]